ncbi:GTPase, partial [Listeria monocytogenes]|nr:GTPase [Listeria monocytogenes]
KSISKELVVVSFGRSAVGNILKFVPAVGTVAGAAINASVASGITEALGWVTVKMLNDGEDVFEQVMSFKGQFHTLFNALKVGKKSK